MRLKELVRNNDVRKLNCNAISPYANLMLCRVLYNCMDVYVRNLEIDLRIIKHSPEVMNLHVQEYVFDDDKLIVELS